MMFVGLLPWYVAGPLIGLAIIFLRTAVNRPFGALGGFIDVAENASTPKKLGFRSYLLLGLAIGGGLFAVLSGRFSLTFGYGDPGSLGAYSMLAQATLLVVAGVVMGFGARTAGGCTSGHGMSGISLFSPASIVATMTFFATSVGVALLTARLGGAS